jgi:hypothetical protein
MNTIVPTTFRLWAVFLCAFLAAVSGCGPRDVALPQPASTATTPAISTPEQAADAGVRYLLGRQDSKDGAWRSPVYGHFNHGDALTPLVLSALLESPPREDTKPACRKGARYLAELIQLRADTDGPVELQYTVYTAALAVRVLSRPEHAEHLKARDAWLALLRRQQLAEAGGWRPADDEYGGWGYSDGPPRKPRPGEPVSSLAEANLSATVSALEALRAAGASVDDPAVRHGLVFVRRCQNLPSEEQPRRPHIDDGGFFFLHHDGIRNKAGPADTTSPRVRYRSYGSTTADGLRALVACGLGTDDPPARAAVRWFEHHFRANEHPGAFLPEGVGHRDGLFFYYAASVSQALTAAKVPVLQTPGGPIRWADALAAELVKRQLPDGSWSNAAATMREDDPVLATAWAVMALSVAGQAPSR